MTTTRLSARLCCFFFFLWFCSYFWCVRTRSEQQPMAKEHERIGKWPEWRRCAHRMNLNRQSSMLCLSSRERERECSGMIEIAQKSYSNGQMECAKIELVFYSLLTVSNVDYIRCTSAVFLCECWRVKRTGYECFNGCDIYTDQFALLECDEKKISFKTLKFIIFILRTSGVAVCARTCRMGQKKTNEPKTVPKEWNVFRLITSVRRSVEYVMAQTTKPKIDKSQGAVKQKHVYIRVTNLTARDGVAWCPLTRSSSMNS